MLVLSRKPGEKIHIGNNITITVVETNGNRVRLSIDAPDQIRIQRGELAEYAGTGMAVGGNHAAARF